MIAGEFFLAGHGLNLTNIYARAMKETEYKVLPSFFDSLSLVRLRLLFGEGGGVGMSLEQAITRENDRRAAAGLEPIPAVPRKG